MHHCYIKFSFTFSSYVLLVSFDEIFANRHLDQSSERTAPHTLVASHWLAREVISNLLLVASLGSGHGFAACSFAELMCVSNTLLECFSLRCKL
jgi:hypothetical protein